MCEAHEVKLYDTMVVPLQIMTRRVIATLGTGSMGYSRRFPQLERAERQAREYLEEIQQARVRYRNDVEIRNALERLEEARSTDALRHELIRNGGINGINGYREPTASDETSNGAPDETSNEISDQASNEVPEEAPDEAPDEAPEGAPDVAPDVAPDQVSNECIHSQFNRIIGVGECGVCLSHILNVMFRCRGCGLVTCQLCRGWLVHRN
ncbi:hypothetical protein GGR58DRAFT_237746 [Xylaria digitata]|nr:hypothetical protein GGR58DRAFT_237746 [Xylaria digitata]